MQRDCFVAARLAMTHRTSHIVLKTSDWGCFAAYIPPHAETSLLGRGFHGALMVHRKQRNIVT